MNDALNYCKKDVESTIEITKDMVNHPDHYISDDGLETIDVIESWTKDLKGYPGYLTGNIIKYISRWNKKNGVEDLKKAEWYLKRLISHMEGEEDEEEEEDQHTDDKIDSMVSAADYMSFRFGNYFVKGADNKWHSIKPKVKAIVTDSDEVANAIFEEFELGTRAIVVPIVNESSIDKLLAMITKRRLGLKPWYFELKNHYDDLAYNMLFSELLVEAIKNRWSIVIYKDSNLFDFGVCQDDFLSKPTICGMPYVVWHI